MNRIHQTNPAHATGKTKQLFDAVQGNLGMVPNLVRVFGNSTAALEGFLGLSGALAGGVLPAKLREQIALAVSEINGCGYCLSAHTVLGGKAGLNPEDIRAARSANASDEKADAALKLARAVTLQRGQIADSDLQAARSAGLSDAEIVEVVGHVALTVLTNYTNNVARTEIDFPKVEPGELEPATCGVCATAH